MIGEPLCRLRGAPGSVIRDGQKVKVMRGWRRWVPWGRAAGERDGQGIDESAEDQEDWDKVVPEGVEAVVPYRGMWPRSSTNSSAVAPRVELWRRA